MTREDSFSDVTTCANSRIDFTLNLETDFCGLASHATVAPASSSLRAWSSRRKIRQLNPSCNGREKLNRSSHPPSEVALTHVRLPESYYFQAQEMPKWNKIFHFSAKYFLFHFTIPSCFSQFFRRFFFFYAFHPVSIRGAVIQYFISSTWVCTLFIECFIRFVFFSEKTITREINDRLNTTQTRWLRLAHRLGEWLAQERRRIARVAIIINESFKIDFYDLRENDMNGRLRLQRTRERRAFALN